MWELLHCPVYFVSRVLLGLVLGCENCCTFQNTFMNRFSENAVLKCCMVATFKGYGEGGEGSDYLMID